MSHSQIPRVRTFRSPVIVMTVLGLGATFAVLPAGTAHASTVSAASAEAAFLANTNAARAANGLARYSVSSDLVSVARAHSGAMASSQTLYHNPALTTAITNWQAVGENVGDGPTESDLQTAFMQSPEHRANILDRDFTQVGIGVVIDSHGTMWVTEDFRQPIAVAKAAAIPSPPATHAVTAVHPTARALAVVHRATAPTAAKHPRAVPAQPRRTAARAAATSSGPSIGAKPTAPDSDAVAMSSAVSPARLDARLATVHFGILFRPEIMLILLALAWTLTRALASRRGRRARVSVSPATP